MSDRFKVVVQPFAVVGQAEGAEAVGLAFAQSVASSLSQVRNLDVVVADGTGGGTHLLHGSLVRGNDTTQLDAELTERPDGKSLWQSGQRDTGNDFSRAASELAQRVIAVLGLALPTLYPYIDDLRLGAAAAASPLVETARSARGRGDYDEWIEVSSNLADEFSEDPVAQVLAAWALTLAWDSAPNEEVLTRLRERLIELDRVDPESPYDDLIRAYIYRSSGEPGQARVVYSWVLDGATLSNTARAWALRQRALADLQVGDAESARHDAQEAVALDPSKPTNLIALSKALEALGRLDEAIDVSLRALALEPHWRHHQRVGLVYSRANRSEEATRSLRSACDMGKNQEACANLAVVLGRAGDIAAAREAAEYAESLAGTQWGAYNLACYYARTDDLPGAIRGLERALELGFADNLIVTDPDFDSVRDSAEFSRVAAEIEARLTSRRGQSSSIFPWQS